MFQIIQYVPCQSLIVLCDFGKISRSKQFLSIFFFSPLMSSDDCKIHFESDTSTGSSNGAKQSYMQTLQNLVSSTDPVGSPT